MSSPDLAALLAAERPVPRPEFTAGLDARAAAGFPRPARARRAQPSLRLPRLSLAPALAGVAALVVAVIVVASTLGGGSGSPESYSLPARSSAGARAGSSAQSAPSAHAAPAPADTTGAAGSAFRGRDVVRATELTLGVPARRMQTTAQRVYAVAGAFGGIVDSSSVSSGGAGPGATFTLRIPSARAPLAVERLAGLGRVVSQTGTTTDVTGSVISARERLASAAALRSGILRALAKASTPGAVDALRARLRDAERRLAAARAQVRSLRGQVDYARVSLTLTSSRVAPPPPDRGGGYTPGDALGDAGRILGVGAAVGLVVLLLALPLAALGGLATLGARQVRRHRRETALGA